MKAFMELEDYRKSIYRLFGRFPLLLMIVGCVGAYLFGIIATSFGGTGAMDDPIGFEGLSNGFFRGVVFSVLIYYVGRIFAESVVKKSHGLTDREATGYFVPCMSHKNLLDFSGGNIVMKADRFYFEPSRPFGGDLAFDFPEFTGFSFALSKPKESLGLFLITGENYMLTVNNEKGNRVGKFIIPEPERYLPSIQKLLEEVGSDVSLPEA